MSVFGELLLNEVLSQEFLLTRFLSGVGDCLKSVVSLEGQKKDRSGQILTGLKLSPLKISSVVLSEALKVFSPVLREVSLVPQLWRS